MIDYMNDTTFILIILGAMIVTYIPRMIPLILLTKTKLPDKVELFLDYIPIAILGSILFQSIIIRDSQFDFSFTNEYIIVGIITIIFAKFVKRIDYIVLFGIILMIVIRLIF